MTSLLQHRSLGSIERAQGVAQRAIQEVAGYRALVSEQKLASETGLKNLPLTDKANYIKQRPIEQLVGTDFDQTFHIFSSSGSSGQPFYWPQLKTCHRASAERLRHFLEQTFRIHERRTLAIVGLALGSWIGGDHLSWLLKSLAIQTPYPFVVFSPGNKHQEIISMLISASPFVDQFILACCPSAIGHLTLRAEQAGTPLPLEKMRFLVIGEPFPEMLRTELETRAKVPAGETLMLSIYGSADTGVLGFESPASVALRKIVQAEPAIAEELGLGQVIPHFFHQADPGTYLETVNEELCITKWQGIPLVRYNLHDNARLYDWHELSERFPIWAERHPSLAEALGKLSRIQKSISTPGLIAIEGRADSCLILCGTNMSESMFENVMSSSSLTPWLTGHYQASIRFQEGRQKLCLKLEYHARAGCHENLADFVYPLLIKELGRVQPEFQDDWDSIYRHWDNQPAERILQLELVAWPEMSRSLETKIKRRGIVA